MQSIVSIDIETTGLSEERDSIIEIGAVKFKGHRMEAEWTSLINPGKHIPEFISGLTGITDAEVRNAPKFRDIAQDLEAFVGNAPVIGHNVRFDLGFLQRAGGIERLHILEGLAPHARSLRIYGDAAGGTCGFELVLDKARFHLVLSHDVWRGFSGEGQALAALAGGDWQAALPRVRAALKWEPVIDRRELGRQTGLTDEAIRGALHALGARGLAEPLTLDSKPTPTARKSRSPESCERQIRSFRPRNAYQ
jgi:hypothetical protein